MVGIVMMLAVGEYTSASAVDGANSYVLDLINQYRTAPYEHAVALGYDPAVLAEMGIVPETRLRPYEMDETLFESAENANALAAGTVDETWIPVSADRLRTVQTGSTLTFSNFIPMETAGSFFIENLIKRELDSGNFQYILSTDFRYAGVSMVPGVLDGLNTWFSSLVLGTSARVIDIQMLNLINQVRAEPELVPLSVSTDFLELLKQNQRIHQLPLLQFQPVFFNEQLYGFAEADVIGSNGEEGGSKDLLEEVILQALPEVNPESVNSYSGGYFDIATAGVTWTDLAEARVVTDLFSALLVNEFSTWPYNAVIFSNHYNEAGVYISVEPGEPVPSPETWKPPLQPGVGAVSYVSGPGVPVTDSVMEPARIYGILFVNSDGDYIYAPGDEVPRETVTVYDVHRNWVTSAVTDNAGHFSVTLEPGWYWFEAWHSDQYVHQLIQVERDQFLKLGFDSIPFMTSP